MLRRREFLAMGSGLASGAASAAPPPNEWLDVTGAAFPGDCWRWTAGGGVLESVSPLEAFRDLRSSVEVNDFEFRFECKLARGANSGVKYLLGKVEAWRRPGESGEQARARGFELQLIDDAHAEDARRDPSHVTGALYGILAPSRRPPPIADGRFHEVLIRRRGPEIEHHVDGELLLAARLDGPAVASRCLERKMPLYQAVAARPSPVALQHHNSPAWFRNLVLRPL